VLVLLVLFLVIVIVFLIFIRSYCAPLGSSKCLRLVSSLYPFPSMPNKFVPGWGADGGRGEGGGGGVLGAQKSEI
jgi:hypothetical protein